MSALDDVVGRVVNGLKQAGLFDNTLIIFTSDVSVTKFRTKLNNFNSKMKNFKSLRIFEMSPELTISNTLKPEVTLVYQIFEPRIKPPNPSQAFPKSPIDSQNYSFLDGFTA